MIGLAVLLKFCEKWPISDRTSMPETLNPRCCQISRNPDHIVSILKAKIVDTNEVPGSPFFS